MPDFEKEVQALKSRVAKLEAVVQAQQEEIKSMASSINLVRQKPQQNILQPNKQVKVPPVNPMPTKSVKQKASANSKQWLDRNLETKIGGTWLNRIGIVAFILGMGFFLKYAFDNQWVGPTGRVIIGLMVGLLFLVSGEWSQKKKYIIFGQGLTGGGIAILYFAIFAAFNFYHLIGQIPAFGLMIMVTVTAVLLSVRYNALAISLIGIIGGFLTPFMLSNGQTNETALFVYIGILDLGILALAYFKNWRIINLISYVLTMLVIISWLILDFHQGEIWLRQTIFTSFFVIFAFLAFFYNIVHKNKTKPDDLILIGLNAASFFAFSYFNLKLQYDGMLGFFAVLMSVIYFGLGYLTIKANREDRFLVMSFLGIALTFLTIAIPIQLHGQWIAMAWSVESFVLLATGFSLSSIKTRYAALFIMGLVVLNLFTNQTQSEYFYSPEIYYPIVNWSGITFLVGIAAVWGGAWLYRKYREKLTSSEKSFATILAILGNLLLLFFLSSENYFFYGSLWKQPEYQQAFWLQDAQQLTLSAIWGIYSIVLIVIGIIKRFQPIRMFAILLFAVTIIKVFLFDLSNLDTVYRIISFIGLGLILILVSFLYQRYREQIMDLVTPEQKKEGMD